MKKVASVFITLMCMVVLIGCSDTLSLDSKNHVTSEKLVDAIKNVHAESNIYYVQDEERLSIELVYKNNNAKEMYNQFSDNVKEIINDDKQIILNYPQIKEISFIPLLDKQALGCSSLYKIENKDIVCDKNDVKEENFNRALKTTDEKTNVELPQSNEIKKATPEEQIKFENSKDEIQKSLNALKVKKDGYIIDAKLININGLEEKVLIKVDVVTNKDITVGQMTNVRNTVVKEIQKIVKAKIIEIDLNLNGKDKGNYTFEFGKGWDKQIQP